METGHARTAKAFILERDRRARIRSALRVRHEEASGARELPKVDARAHATVSPWSKGKIVEALMIEGDVEAAVAEEIASEVERRVFSSGLTRVSTALIRALVDNELFERGYERVLNRQVVIGLPRYDLDRMARSGMADDESVDGSPADLDHAVARATWTHYSLLEVYPTEVVEAHLSGRLHLGAIGAPTSYEAVEIDASHALRAPSPIGESAFDRLRWLFQVTGRRVAGAVRMRGVMRLLCDGSELEPDDVARRLMLALSSPLDAAAPAPWPEVVVGLRPPERPSDEEADAGPGHRALVAALLKAASVVGVHRRVPRLALDISGATEDDVELLAAASLAEAGPGHAVMFADGAFAGPLSSYSPVHLRVDIDVAQAAFRAPRFETAAVIAQVDKAIELAAAACEARSTFIQSLPGQASPRECLRRLAGPTTRARSAAVATRSASPASTRPCRVAFDHGIARDDRARDFAFAVIDAASAAVRHHAQKLRLPLTVAYTDDPRVLSRFGRIDFERHPRGRDVHGVSHDGRKYLYVATLGGAEQEPDPIESARIEARLRRGFVPTSLPVYHSLASERARFAHRFAGDVQGESPTCS